jgi:hypothetical protein
MSPRLTALRSRAMISTVVTDRESSVPFDLEDLPAAKFHAAQRIVEDLERFTTTHVVTPAICLVAGAGFEPATFGL